MLDFFKKTEYIDFETYKEHITFLDDLHFKQEMMKRRMAEI